MRYLITILAVAVLVFPLTTNATEIGPGPVSGDWYSSGNPYNVNGEINVPVDSTLNIHEGVEVIFQGHYKLIVNGYLEAIGTESDSVLFTAADITEGWHGIRFSNAQDNSHLSYCIIQYGRARGPDPDWFGGGIHCENSSPTISHCTIRWNWAEYWNGGLSLGWDSSPILEHCLITQNSADSASGGVGVGYGANAKISYCTVSENTGGFYAGGGIALLEASATIEHCTVVGNTTDMLGGGIEIEYSSATITNCTISGNEAGMYGGGVDIWYSTVNMSNNTISGNTALWYGGGIACNSSAVTITNTVLWGDSAPFGPEIYFDYPNPTVTYCDVQGGWEGVGCIDADPIFAGPYNEDFHLRWHSPCIDAGDPNSPLDPDGTRSDMGAFYFNQAVLGIVEVYPHDEPIVIPPQGGDLTYDGGVLNLSRGELTVDIWACAFVPGLSQPHRLWRYNDITIPPGDSIVRADLSEHVPDFAPGGDYSFVTYIGDFGSSIIDSSCFYFSKEEPAQASSQIDNWRTLKGWFDDDFVSTGSGLPTHYALSQNYPNPFNATAAINYQLPVTSHVRLEIYNLLGRTVATLVDETQEAGYRSVSWDASEVSSGLYFYKLTAGDYTNTRRMMLVK